VNTAGTLLCIGPREGRKEPIQTCANNVMKKHYLQNMIEKIFHFKPGALMQVGEQQQEHSFASRLHWSS
jgi:hypothetical protein